LVATAGAGDAYGNILEQAALGRRTFRIRGFKQQYSGAASGWPISGLPRRHARAPSTWQADCLAHGAGLYQVSGPPRPMDDAKQMRPEGEGVAHG
jgi:hypothetical protein